MCEVELYIRQLVLKQMLQLWNASEQVAKNHDITIGCHKHHLAHIFATGQLLLNYSL